MPGPSESTEIRLPVALGPRAYDIVVTTAGMGGFGPFARSALDATWAGKGCRTALVVGDANVAELDPFRAVQQSLREAGIEPHADFVPAGEATKSLESAARLYDTLIEMRADRHTVVVAVGGGVVGDLAGFVAATFMRGLPLLMVPTSLLAQVDSSVGGKVGVNHPKAKNCLGAFHQPAGVWIDTTTLGTLPDRELRCGLAEVVKYGVILDADFFRELESNVNPILARDPDSLRKVVARCCRLKADVVALDEREETGLRAVLNFGHTVGHAIEAVAGYGGEYQHGEAVAVGMVAESLLAGYIGWMERDETLRLATLLQCFGLPISAPGLDRGALRQAMSRDKKNLGGKVRFVLPRYIGYVELTDLPESRQILTVLDLIAPRVRATGDEPE